jgi:hypothetical protein
VDGGNVSWRGITRRYGRSGNREVIVGKRVELEFKAQHFQAWKPDLNSFDSKSKVKTF